MGFFRSRAAFFAKAQTLDNTWVWAEKVFEDQINMGKAE